MDSTFLDLFDFELKVGESTVLNNPSRVVVTNSFAKRTFGEENPLGKTVTIRCDHEEVYIVGAVLQDIPSSSSITFDFLIPKHSQRRWRRLPQELVLLKEDAAIADFNKKVKEAARENPRFPESEIKFYPISKIYFDKIFPFILFSKYGDRDQVATMKIVAFAILFITLLMTGWTFGN